MSYRAVALLLLSLTFSVSARAATELAITPRHADGASPGLEVSRAGKPLARFVFGPAELKPYLQLFGPEGEALNEWNPNQPFPHHRGIYIGWNRVRSNLGSSDLWHMRRGERMVVTATKHEVKANKAQITAEIEWHSARPENGEPSTLLLKENRSIEITDNQGALLVDISFHLSPQRDLSLDGDLQHSGIHFRAAHTVAERSKETAYVWEPDLPGPGGKVQSPDLKWCRLIFPIETKWFSATQLNAPSNPTAELSWRDYGRFGFFFKKELKKDEALTLHYRFVVEPAEAPERARLAEHRIRAAAIFSRFLTDLDKRN